MNVRSHWIEATATGVTVGVTEFITAETLRYFKELQQRDAFLQALPVAIVIGAIVLILLLRRARAQERRDGEPVVNDFAYRTAIKGLLPFGSEDAELFGRLQREDIIKESVHAITATEFRFGVLSGESGSGKTSFLQAGLKPGLLGRKCDCVLVTFSNLDPLDSIRQALAEQLQITIKEDVSRNLLMALDVSRHSEPKPLVLLFDQFEQFFVHRRYKKEREPFLRMLADWYCDVPGSS